ncbi:hypothetical protein AX17_005132 [Amanita inopinata Kibby_2008]|nr:hypothetical protein AX17_005132 [Amanita inopinata Kibby_2008]
MMPKEPPRWCDCCKAMVSASTEQRHRQGLQAPHRIRVLASEKSRNSGRRSNIAVKGPETVNQLVSPANTSNSALPLSISDLPMDVEDDPSTFEEVAPMSRIGRALETGPDVHDKVSYVSMDEVLTEVQKSAWSGRQRYCATVEDVDDDSDNNPGDDLEDEDEDDASIEILGDIDKELAAEDAMDEEWQ